MKNTNPISPTDLNTIIMSVIHEVKNSLLSSTASLDKISLELSSAQQTEINTVQNEIKNINQSLMRMLTLYKMQTNIFSLSCDQHNVYDFLEELVFTNSSSLSSNKIELLLQCDEDLDWFFDLELISNVINSTINNALRYVKQKIIIKATIKNDLLSISVEDDGPGYSQKMLDQNQTPATEINFTMGKSGLGLFFSSTIAKLHQFKNKQGFTRISNLESGGSCFTIYLP
ncbi:MAG: HAMP domain-containing sensor histidine kinase [Pseudomonadota bacterium]